MNFKNFKRYKIRILDLCRSLQLNVGVVGLYGRWRQRRLLAASWTSRTTEVCRRCFPMQTPRSRLTQITPVSRSNLSYVSPRRFLTLRCSCAAEGLRYRLGLTGVTETMEVYLGLCIIGTARTVCDGRGSVRPSVSLSQHGPHYWHCAHGLRRSGVRLSVCRSTDPQKQQHQRAAGECGQSINIRLLRHDKMQANNSKQKGFS